MGRWTRGAARIATAADSGYHDRMPLAKPCSGRPGRTSNLLRLCMAKPSRLMLVAVTVAACKGEATANALPATHAAPSAEATANAPPATHATPSAEATDMTPPAHDPAHPPIDCPLRRQGIDPAHLKPFEDTEKYIAFLERPDRAAWQKPDEVVAALSLRGGETVVDLGAGSGYFTFRFARALPRGKVVAADTEAEMIRHIHHKAMADGLRNIEPVVITGDDPKIPSDADLVFVCDVLHHVPNRAAWLSKLATEMKPGARLVLVEFKEGKLPEGPPEAVKIGRAEMVRLATAAKLGLVFENTTLLPYQLFLVFEKAS
jgi:SAM-dependent methyltransferase